jgi:hypothetical protein
LRRLERAGLASLRLVGPRSLAEAKTSGSKSFFFEKKKQRTFDFSAAGGHKKDAKTLRLWR